MQMYSVLKKPRALQLAPQLGSVELELRFDDGATRFFTVTPLQATLIHYLGERAMSVAELEAAMEVDEAEVCAALRFWSSKGVVAEDQDVFRIIEQQMQHAVDDAQAETNRNSAMDIDPSDRLEALQSARQAAAQAQVDSYVRGLLASHGAMGLDRLHMLLQLIRSSAGDPSSAEEGSFAATASALRQFLLSMVDKGVLEVVDGLYALHKPGL